MLWAPAGLSGATVIKARGEGKPLPLALWSYPETAVKPGICL